MFPGLTGIKMYLLQMEKRLPFRVLKETLLDGNLRGMLQKSMNRRIIFAKIDPWGAKIGPLVEFRVTL